MMSPGEIRSALSAQPFRPFTIHLADEMHYDVPTPEYLAYKPDSTALFVWELQRPGFAILSLPAIVRVTYPPEPAENPTA